MKVLLVIIVLFALLLAIAESKGSFGYSRSSGGGYYRSTKRGYYSSRTRYYTTGMYWRTGYSTRYRNTRNIDTSSAGTTSSALKDVLCKREVRYDNATMFSNDISFNATMNCIKELYGIPGDPGNLPYEQLMLNRLQWNVTLNPYPTVFMTVFPDKDIDQALAQLGLRVTRLFVADASGAEFLSIPLNGGTWSPCSLQGCNNSDSGFSVPSSRFLDGGRVFTAAVQALLPEGVIATLRFWVSGDFSEDTEVDHVFLMPSLLKIDVNIRLANGSDFCTNQPSACSSNTFFGVETYLVVPTSGAGSTLTHIPATITSTYAARNMSRVEVGTFADQKDGKASLFSWWSSPLTKATCRTAPTLQNDGGGCVYLLDNSTSSPVNNRVCTALSTDPRCSSLYTDSASQSAVPLRFLLRKNGFNPGSEVEWQTYFQMGYWDPNEGSIPTVSASLTFSMLFVCIISALLLII